jgi:hypothetical protein
MISTYFKTTDVQRTWRRFGWSPPSDNPDVKAKWAFFKSLNTERDHESKGHDESQQ